MLYSAINIGAVMSAYSIFSDLTMEMIYFMIYIAVIAMIILLNYLLSKIVVVTSDIYFRFSGAIRKL